MATRLGDEIKRVMQQQHPPMTQKQLALRLDVEQSTVSRWIRGLSAVHPSLYDEVAEFLDLTVEQVAAMAYQPQSRNDPGPPATSEEEERITMAEALAALSRAVEELTEEVRSRLPPAE